MANNQDKKDSDSIPPGYAQIGDFTCTEKKPCENIFRRVGLWFNKLKNDLGR